MSNDLAFWLRRVIQLLAPVAEPPEAESPLPEQLTVAQKVPPTADELAVEEMWLQRAMAEYDPDRAPHAPGDATPAQRRAAAAAKWGELNAKPPRVEQRLNENLIHAVRQIAQLSVQRFGRSPVGLRMLRHGESGHPAMWYIAEKVEAYDYARYGNGQSGWVECETDEWETAEVARIDLWSPIRNRSRSVYPKNEECTAAVVQFLKETLTAAEHLPATDNGKGEAVPPIGETKETGRKKRGNGKVAELFRGFCLHMCGEHKLADMSNADIARKMTDHFGEKVRATSLTSCKAFKKFRVRYPLVSDPVYQNVNLLQELTAEQHRDKAADSSRRGRRVKM